MPVEGLAKVIVTWNRLFAVELAPYAVFDGPYDFPLPELRRHGCLRLNEGVATMKGD